MLSPQASTQEANFKIVWKDGAKWKFEITEPVNQNSILQGGLQVRRISLSVLILEVVSGDTCYVSIAVVCLFVCLFINRIHVRKLKVDLAGTKNDLLQIAS